MKKEMNLFKKIYIMLIIGHATLFSQAAIPYFDVNLRAAQGSKEVSLSLQLLLLLTILSIAPSLIIMMTAFIRVTIVLKFTQRALSLQQEPPNQVMMGLALFITFYIMQPTITQVYEKAYVPYSKQEISTDNFFKKAFEPIREFMFAQTRQKDIDLFLYLSKKPVPNNRDGIGAEVLIPAFIISEMTTAFKIGILIFIPFIVLDMVVASILMAMGMIMVPPVMVSLPFKIILFVLLDGWHLITRQIVYSFL